LGTYHNYIQLGELTTMDVLFFVLLVIMLVLFGFAQMQKGVVKTPGQINLSEDDK
jgi:hypothetical protein